jgi:hypothetical protein
MSVDVLILTMEYNTRIIVVTHRFVILQELLQVQVLLCVNQQQPIRLALQL